MPLEGPNEPTYDDSPDVALVNQELADQLRQALLILSEQDATIFCLRYLDELPYDEIAQLLGMKVPAVGMSLHRSRARLARHLESSRKGVDHVS